MKPHEETWESIPGIEADVRDVVVSGVGILIRDVPVSVADIVTAAPDMARALLTYRLQHGESCECGGCFLMSAALTKAGVPLP
jgi:hypothetical protein